MRYAICACSAILACSSIAGCSAARAAHTDTAIATARATAQDLIAANTTVGPRVVERVLVCTASNAALCRVECTRVPRQTRVRGVLFLSSNSSGHTIMQVILGSYSHTYAIGPTDSCSFYHMLDPSETTGRG